MKPETAERIINEYGATIANIPEGDKVQDVMQLPYSVGRIRYAYYVYTEALIENGSFNDEVKNNLQMTYALLDCRFVEEPDEINEAFKKYTKSKEARDFLDSKGGIASFVASIESMNEYHNFVADCFGNWNKD